MIGKLTSFSTIYLIKIICVNGEEDWWDNKYFDKSPCIKNYKCINPICFPEDYTTLQPPRKFPKIYFNIALANKSSANERNVITGIDIQKMRFIYSPKILVAWQDPRLKFCNHSLIQKIDDDVWYYIWNPVITVENRANLDSDNLIKTSKFSIRKYFKM